MCDPCILKIESIKIFYIHQLKIESIEILLGYGTLQDRIF